MISLKDRLSEAAARKSICFLSAEGFTLTFETYIIGIPDGFVLLKNSIPFQNIKAFLERPRFSLLLNKERLTSTNLTTDGVNLLFPLSQSDLVEETREEERRYLGSNEVAILKLVNPFDHETIVEKKLLDLSHSGLSIETRVASKLFSPGVEFKKMEIIRSGLAQEACSGTVVYARSYVGLDGAQHCQVGFKLNRG